jgi:AraC family transcriptional regulator of adaptative response / DNA-3-methyladenine glycosylase II
MAAPPGRAALTSRELEDRAREWQPWRGYAVMHLWRAAAEAGRRVNNVRNQRARAGARA